MTARPTGVDQPMDEWLTYAEAGLRHGVTAEAIRQLAMRRRWPRRRTNTLPPRVEVQVPEGEVITPRAPPVERPLIRRSTPVRGELSHAINALEAAVATLREQLERSEARADRLDLLVETERGRIVAVEMKLAASEAGRGVAEAQAAELRAELERLRAAHQEAAQTADQRRQADDARRALGRWARLRAAWRGR